MHVFLFLAEVFVLFPVPDDCQSLFVAFVLPSAVVVSSSSRVPSSLAFYYDFHTSYMRSTELHHRSHCCVRTFKCQSQEPTAAARRNMMIRSRGGLGWLLSGGKFIHRTILHQPSNEAKIEQVSVVPWEQPETAAVCEIL